jgi:hypothetical protein
MTTDAERKAADAARPCLHCELNRVMDLYNERLHLDTGIPANIDHNIADLMACAAELVAVYDDAATRKFVMKRAIKEFERLVRQKRAEGCYPGGPGQTPITHGMAN